MEIIAKRHFIKFYLYLILWISFLIASILIFHNELIKLDSQSIWAWFALVIPLFVIISYLRNSPKLIINKNGILSNTIFYDWKHLSSCKLTGKKRLSIVPEECATLTFNNSKTITIFDDFYSNSSEIKLFIQEIVLNKKEAVEIKEKPNHQINFFQEKFIIYKGYPIFCGFGIIIWMPFLFLIGASMYHLKIYPLKTFVSCSVITVFLMLVYSWLLYYFEVSQNYLIIKNHYYFWKKEIYYLSDIKEIVFEERYGKRPKSLTIITFDFKTERYYAGSLTSKTWLAMKDELKNQNIVIRNH
ncbi:hypothetical protein [Flavobacterium faecale]|uniref:hypothetical protein n=1 Tax=Flavobacterium faecale TaxID=1355330 RepID=UPI003AAA8331